MPLMNHMNSPNIKYWPPKKPGVYMLNGLYLWVPGKSHLFMKTKKWQCYQAKVNDDEQSCNIRHSDTEIRSL